MTYRKADFFLGDKQAAKVYSRLLRKRVQYLQWFAELVECRTLHTILVFLVSRL